MLLSLMCAALVSLGAAVQNAQYPDQTRNPHGALKMACERCHTTTSWKPIRPFPDFDHRSTRYPLKGMHTRVDCMECHVKLVFSNVGTRCADCHADIHRRQLGNNCEECHDVRGWREINKNVAGHENRFPLLGAHARVECESCHKGAAAGLFRGLSTDCAFCHNNDFLNAKTVNHVTAGFPTRCEICHRFDDWIVTDLDHTKFTSFPLTGVHAGLDCAQCHPNGRFAGTPATCVGCHLQDYNNSTDPNHLKAGFPTDCSICHSSAAWTPAVFDHSKTQFPLTGAHVALLCNACHSSGVYAGLPTACVSCHLAVFNSATNPNHIAAGFPQNCSVCHSTAAWTPAVFDHNQTQFPLTGAHVGLQCNACHSSGVYAGLSTACASCHLATFNSTTNPNHIAAGFPQDCSVCHSTAAWTPAVFDHSKTQFPLTGAHVGLQCNACHSSGVYAGLPTACVSCHLANFNSTTNPNHVTSGYPQDCSICHSTAAWTPSTFDHNATKFPLTGAHITVLCANCHIGGVYAGTPTDCYSCHSNEYNTVTDPNHVAAGFSKDCSQCHTTTSWTGAVFNHTWFPIYSGTHAGRWTTCADCHTNSNDYSVFSCITCHTHDQATTDPEHTGVANYVYNGTSCYTCHPTGQTN